MEHPVEIISMKKQGYVPLRLRPPCSSSFSTSAIGPALKQELKMCWCHEQNLLRESCLQGSNLTSIKHQSRNCSRASIFYQGTQSSIKIVDRQRKIHFVPKCSSNFPFKSNKMQARLLHWVLQKSISDFCSSFSTFRINFRYRSHHLPITFATEIEKWLLLILS